MQCNTKGFVSLQDTFKVIIQWIWDLLIGTAKAGCKTCHFQLFSSLTTNIFVSTGVKTQMPLLFFLKYYFPQLIYFTPFISPSFPALSSKSSKSQAQPEEMTGVCCKIKLNQTKANQSKTNKQIKKTQLCHKVFNFQYGKMPVGNTIFGQIFGLETRE